MRRIELAVTMNQLDLSKVPPVVGKEPRDRLVRLYALMNNLTKPLYFVGPAGSGKTVTGMALLKMYAEEYSVPAYIVQVSPELTKSQLVIGKQLKRGSLVTVKGCLAVAAELGAPVLVDEAQQSSQELLATMQSLFERNANITDGSEIVYARDTFRVIFASNASTSHAANVPLPQAFGSRVITERFDYPNFEDEVEITKAIVTDPQFSRLPLRIPDSVVRFVVGLMREHRSEFYPLSARNAAACVGYMNVMAHAKGFTESLKQNANGTFEERVRGELDELARSIRSELNLAQGEGGNQNLEMFLAKTYRRIHDADAASTLALTDDGAVREFLEFLCAYGSSDFTKAIRANFMIDLDLDSSFHDVDAVKQRILASILPA